MGNMERGFAPEKGAICLPQVDQGQEKKRQKSSSVVQSGATVPLVMAYEAELMASPQHLNGFVAAGGLIS
jgi:hypothetical protein